MDIIKYDAEADILVVKIYEDIVKDEKILDNDIVLGLNKDGEIIYIEIWDASKKGLTEALINLARERRDKIKTILEST